VGVGEPPSGKIYRIATIMTDLVLQLSRISLIDAVQYCCMK
jgi:hypothetical protein